MADDAVRLNQRQIADLLGVGMQAVKKWRGNTIAALRAAGQFDHAAPTVALPTNALPIPVNQREHVAGDNPLWDRDEILRWAERTERRDPDTKATTRPSPPGRRPLARVS
jgi:hypothetical protein